MDTQNVDSNLEKDETAERLRKLLYDMDQRKYQKNESTTKPKVIKALKALAVILVICALIYFGFFSWLFAFVGQHYVKILIFLIMVGALYLTLKRTKKLERPTKKRIRYSAFGAFAVGLILLLLWPILFSKKSSQIEMETETSLSDSAREVKASEDSLLALEVQAEAEAPLLQI